MMPEAPEADRAVLRQAMGFNDPLVIQFVRFVAHALRGDFGNSFFHRAPALGLVLDRMSTTLTLTAARDAAGPGRGDPRRHPERRPPQLPPRPRCHGRRLPRPVDAGLLDRDHADSPLRRAAGGFFPVSGWDSWGAAVLPTLTLGTFTAPLLLRIVRSSMLEVISLDYVRTARAKGLSEWLVICRHALRNAALPLVTVAGLQFGLLARRGAVITETVFAVPGVGRLIVNAIRQLDFPDRSGRRFRARHDRRAVNFVVDMLYIVPEPDRARSLSALMAIGHAGAPGTLPPWPARWIDAEPSRAWRKRDPQSDRARWASAHPSHGRDRRRDRGPVAGPARSRRSRA